ncbi:MAG TPA: hypothetical protein VM012_05805 [Flavitalea sp.]|nr:hypothetical protein [Flavitalea sp.]
MKLIFTGKHAGIFFLSVFFFSMIIIIAGACREGQTTGQTLMPQMNNTDSIQVLYFTTPGQVRFFTYVPVNDKVFIGQLVKDLTSDTVDANNCEKNGKIYFYAKGELFNTVFFGYTKDDCKILRYIKNGKLYHFAMSDEVRKKIAELKTLSIDPSR